MFDEIDLMLLFMIAQIVLLLLILWRIYKMAIAQEVLDKTLADLTAAVDKVIGGQVAATPDTAVQALVDGTNAQTARLNPPTA